MQAHQNSGFLLIYFLLACTNVHSSSYEKKNKTASPGKSPSRGQRESTELLSRENKIICLIQNHFFSH